MAVGAQTQQLQISSAEAVNHRIVAGALPFRIGIHTVGNVAVCLIDIHMVKQIGAHKVCIALIVILGQAHILIQVYGTNLGEIQVTALIHGNQFLIGAHRAAAGGQTQHAIGFQLNLCGDDVCSLPADIGIVFCANQSHNVPFLSVVFLFKCFLSRIITPLLPDVQFFPDSIFTNFTIYWPYFSFSF